MNEIVKFYKEKPVRIVEKDGEPWFVANDVCGILGLANPRSSILLLDKDEKGVHSMDTPSGNQQMNIVSEAGVYSLIFRSRRPEAKKFKRWVTHEVLPSIRKTGAFVAPNADMSKIAALINRLCDRIALLVDDNVNMRAENEYLRQYEPLEEYGAPSSSNGLPRWQYRRGSYVSRNGRRPHRPIDHQLGLFDDYPALNEAEEARRFFSDYPTERKRGGNDEHRWD